MCVCGGWWGADSCHRGTNTSLWESGHSEDRGWIGLHQTAATDPSIKVLSKPTSQLDNRICPLLEEHIAILLVWLADKDNTLNSTLM